jgi:hypothetical protein
MRDRENGGDFCGAPDSATRYLDFSTLFVIITMNDDASLGYVGSDDPRRD